MLIWIKILCLFLSIWFTSVNLMKMIRGHRITTLNFVVMAAAITGFAVLQFELYY